MVFVNGIKSSQTSVFDRGLLYGQSVFETIAIINGKPSLINEHFDRLQTGCHTLAIPCDVAVLKNEIRDFLEQLPAHSNKVLRITITMGEGGRGYLDPENPCVSRILSSHDMPRHAKENWQQGIILGLSDVKLAAQPLLAGIKHGNRLEQILARRNWLEHWQEAVLCDYDDNVIEATQSNVFIVKNNCLKTPALTHCGVLGVMRNHVSELADKLGFDVQNVSLSVNDLYQADEIFVTNSIIGVWPVRTFQHVEFSDFSVSQKLLKSIIKNEVIPHY